MLVENPSLAWEEPIQSIRQSNRIQHSVVDRTPPIRLYGIRTCSTRKRPVRIWQCHENHWSSIVFRKCDCVIRSIKHSRNSFVCQPRLGGHGNRLSVQVENDTEFRMNTCVHSSLSFPVAEDGREVFVEFVPNLWGQKREVESTRYGIVNIIAEIESTLSRAINWDYDPAVERRLAF